MSFKYYKKSILGDIELSQTDNSESQRKKITLDEHFSNLDKLYEVRGFLYSLRLLEMDEKTIIEKSKAMYNIDSILHRYGYPAQKIISKQNGDSV